METSRLPHEQPHPRDGVWLRHYFGLLVSRLEPDSGKYRILPMEGIRGFAATLVFFVHFNSHYEHFSSAGIQRRALQILGALGHTGVDIFFILSGYLIYGIVMDDRFVFWKYLRRRLQRLYPTFLVVFAIYLASSWLVPARSKLPSQPGKAIAYIVANLLMLPGMLPIKPIITVAWSLSYEWFFYFLLPGTVRLMRARCWRWEWRVGFTLVLSVAWVWAGQIRFTSHSRLVAFAAGVVLWELLHNTRISFWLPRWGEWASALLFCGNLLLIGVSGASRGNTTLVLERIPSFYAPSLCVTGGLLVLYAIAFPGFLARLFSLTPLRWMGNISYSYYLIHGLTLLCLSVVANRLLRQQLNALLVLLLMSVCFIATVFTALALYLAAEWPLSLAPSLPVVPKPIPQPKFDTYEVEPELELDNIK